MFVSLAEALRVKREERLLPRIVGSVSPRILTLDIETTPNVAHTWGLWDQNIGLNQLVQVGGLLCLVAKWYDEPDPIFLSEWGDGRDGMVREAWRLLDEADYVVGFNSQSFDVKHLNREFALLGLPKPRPFRNVDLLLTARRHFRFASNKLDFIAGQLGLGHKVKHEGHDLWKACMAGDSGAQQRMEEYNVQDVLLTEQLFDRLRPWLGSQLNLGLYAPVGSVVCPSCGSEDLLAEGSVETGVSRYLAQRCNACGAVSRGLDLEVRTRQRGV